MANLAAVLPAEKAPLEVREVEKYTPGPNELLVKVEAIAHNPVEWKIAKIAIFPISYPSILGGVFGGKVEAVGSDITKFKVGDKVGVYKPISEKGNKYSAFQQYALAVEDYTTKVPDNSSVDVTTSLLGNLPTVVGLFTAHLGLDKPKLDGSASKKDKKILVYGGTSSFGSLAVQYLAQAGYSVVTTTSPQHKEFVSKLGAARVVDHTQDKDALIKELVAEGPYEAVVDSISLPTSVPVTAAVVAAQGGSHVWSLLPAFGPETLPEGVSRKFDEWSAILEEDKFKDLIPWAHQTYIAQALAEGKIVPLRIEKRSGGLEGLNATLDKFQQGVSGVKLVSSPWG